MQVGHGGTMWLAWGGMQTRKQGKHKNCDPTIELKQPTSENIWTHTKTSGKPSDGSLFSFFLATHVDILPMLIYLVGVSWMRKGLPAFFDHFAGVRSLEKLRRSERISWRRCNGCHMVPNLGDLFFFHPRWPMGCQDLSKNT